MRTHRPANTGARNPLGRKTAGDSGRSGIRTHEPLAGLTVFKTVAFVRSATLPRRL
jgi:hypothetical protein